MKAVNNRRKAWPLVLVKMKLISSARADIRTGYRPETVSFADCLRSVASLHNESGKLDLPAPLVVAHIDCHCRSQHLDPSRGLFCLRDPFSTPGTLELCRRSPFRDMARHYCVRLLLRGRCCVSWGKCAFPYMRLPSPCGPPVEPTGLLWHRRSHLGIFRAGDQDGLLLLSSDGGILCRPRHRTFLGCNLHGPHPKRPLSRLSAATHMDVHRSRPQRSSSGRIRVCEVRGAPTYAICLGCLAAYPAGRSKTPVSA